MEVKELRMIENGYYLNQNGIVEKLELTPYQMDVFQDWQLIPLTEEWLLKLGFENYEWCTDCAFIKFNSSHMMLRYYNDKWHCQKTIVSKDSKGQKMSEAKQIVKKGMIKYVHQLQNLYFALTETELEIKELNSNSKQLK